MMSCHRIFISDSIYRIFVSIAWMPEISTKLKQLTESTHRTISVACQQELLLLKHRTTPSEGSHFCILLTFFQFCLCTVDFVIRFWLFCIIYNYIAKYLETCLNGSENCWQQPRRTYKGYITPDKSGFSKHCRFKLLFHAVLYNLPNRIWYLDNFQPQ